VTYVEVDVEVRVLNPIGTVEFERHLDHLAAERLKVANHDAEPVSYLGERVEICRRALVDAQPIDMPVRVRRLHQQETDVESGELLHVRSLST